MKKNIISISTICLCTFIPFFTVRAETIHFSGDHDVVVGKGLRKELKSSNSNINVILTDGMAVKTASSNDVLRGIYFNGQQKKASTLTHKLFIRDPIKVSLKIYPTGGDYRYQTLMHLGSCELRYDMKKRVLKMISYLDNKTNQSIEMPCEINKWSDIIF